MGAGTIVGLQVTSGLQDSSCKCLCVLLVDMKLTICVL